MHQDVPAFIARSLGAALVLLALWAPAVHAADPARTVGAAECAECHEKSEEAWLKTRHYAIFKETHRSDEGKAIAKKMGVKRMKKPDSTCAGCHYTVGQAGGKAKAISGVSCESCHAPGADWLERHSEFSGKEEAAETDAEAEARWADSEAAGMIRPSNLYALARNCYGCHVTPEEKLVNVGEHPSGSEFELVAWSQGELRHNVWYTEANDEASAERKRQLYLAGQLAEMETALRALAAATEPGGAYAAAMTERAAKAKQSIERIGAATGLAGLDALTAAIGEPAAGGSGLAAAADRIAAEAPGLLADPGALAGLDSLLPGADQYVGDVLP